MLLNKFYNNLDKKFKNITFAGFDFNSKKIKKNYIFFAIQGKNLNGNNFIKDAIKKGAKIVFSNKFKTGFNKKIFYIKVKDTRLELSKFSSKFYSKKPKNIIAVTGTNGKSSIVNFYHQILKLNKKRVCSIGTLGVKYNSTNLKKNNTTFDPITINKILHDLKTKKINNVIMEASSHGLDQKRLHGIKFSTSIFTNLSRDHLDYHKNYKNYLNSKLILFKELTKKNGNIIFEKDLKTSKKLINISKKEKLNVFTVGKKNSVLNIEMIKILNRYQHITFLYKKKRYYFKTKLIGKIQIKNLMMAVAAAIKSNIKIENIVNKLEKIKPVNGRFEEISKIHNNSSVILDYAHTPEALKTCIENIKEQFPLRKVSLLFGCGGERDVKKREIMGKIANNMCNNIYLTDDNPRNENPLKIRQDIKRFIKKSKLKEIPSRSLAIKTAILNGKSDEVLIVAGKGHEQIQEYAFKKYFSDKHEIKSSIKILNHNLSRNWKLNILKEFIKNKNLDKLSKFNLSTNSKDKNLNKIFFGIEGKSFNGGDFVDEALKNGAKIAFVDKIKKNNNKKIKVKSPLKLLTDISKKIRISSAVCPVAITGSSGKTSLKDLLGQSLQNISKTIYSRQSFNNKFGVPISLFKLNKNSNFGIFEIGMDRAGEINNLSKIIKPDIGVITNISYAHARNFQSIIDIAKSKSEIIYNITKNGSLVLNKDDKFFDFFYEIAKKKKLNIVSYGLNKTSNITISKIQKLTKYSVLSVIADHNLYKFNIKNDMTPYISNILASVAVLKTLLLIDKINSNFFLNFKIPSGRGNITKIKIGSKKINLIDESYNSNPLSLKFSIKKFENLKINYKKKYLLLGDMLELGKFSKKLHEDISDDINRLKFNKIFVHGKEILYTFNKIRTQKKGRILKTKDDIYDFIKKDLKNDDFIMIKGSNSTGLNQITKKIRERI